MEMMFDVMLLLAVNPDLGGEMTDLHAGTKSPLSYIEGKIYRHYFLLHPVELEVLCLPEIEKVKLFTTDVSSVYVLPLHTLSYSATCVVLGRVQQMLHGCIFEVFP
jgi:hypothetical protein